MRRRVFNLLSAISLLLCATTGVIWILSQFVETRPMDLMLPGHRTSFDHREITLVSNRWLMWFGTGRESRHWNRFGCTVEWYPLLHGEMPLSPPSEVESYPLYAVRLRYPTVIVFTSMLPVLSLILWWKRSKPSSLCRTCGYDLRATPDRCPECGHKPSSESASG